MNDGKIDEAAQMLKGCKKASEVCEAIKNHVEELRDQPLALESFKASLSLEMLSILSEAKV